MSPASNRHRRIIVYLAVRVLHDVIKRPPDVPMNTIEVRLSLRCLVEHFPHRGFIDTFWQSARAHDTSNALARATAS